MAMMALTKRSRSSIKCCKQVAPFQQARLLRVGVSAMFDLEGVRAAHAGAGAAH